MEGVFGELGGRKFKYEDCKLWVLREMWGTKKMNPPYWVVLKGATQSCGYKQIKINNTFYLYHRVVYFLHHQDWDIHDTSSKNTIDHIDRNPQNNNIDNLRVLTQQQNLWNSNAKGYNWDSNAKKWRAQICVNRKSIYLGGFSCEADANNAYQEAKLIYHKIAEN